MHVDYINDIKAYYQHLKNQGKLRPRLLSPTPKKIKDECLAAVEDRFQASDYALLSSFFQPKSNDKADVLKAIKKFHRDQFRPLVNFLRERNPNTSDLNIELLGWLIDFPVRPFHDATYMRDREILNLTESQEYVPPLENPAVASESLDQEHTVNTVTEAHITDTNSSQASNLTTLPGSRSAKRLRPSMLLLLIGTALLTSFGIYQITEKGAGVSEELQATTFDSSSPTNSTALNTRNSETARCVGNTPCKACSNCSMCKWCASGGTCGACPKPSKTKKTTTTPTRSAQCQATTKKGTQCSRNAKSGTKYCWQHA